MYRIFLPLYLIIGIQILFYDAIYSSALFYFLEEDHKADTAKDYHSAFALTEKALYSMPESEWEGFLSSISQQSNFPYTLVDATHLTLPEEILSVLNNQQIWVDDVEDDVLYKRIPNTNYLLKIGPMETIETLEEQAIQIDYILSSGFILLVLIWVIRLQLNLNKLNRTTELFGQGDLSARASDKRRHRVGNLNNVFNHMAHRVQKLVLSHKELTNSISHELRTPITRLRFEFDYLQETNKLKEIAPSLDSMAQDINELDDLVDELLTHAKMERASNMMLSDHYILQWMVKWHEQQRHSGESIQVELALPKDDFIVKFDAHYISRALANLVGNSLRYAGERVRVSVEKRHDNVCIHVDDDGPGIPKAQRPELFEPFVRVDKSRSKKTGGFGLGLSIVKQITLSHNGTVTIEDAPLGGARFTLCWPLDGEKSTGL